MDTFDALFTKARGIKEEPFPFQRTFALDAKAYSVAMVPTGLGKTAMAVLGWLWRRRYAQPEIRGATPRRLVYCLPMRVLVEQSAENARAYLANLGLSEDVKVHVLMGGEQTERWEFYPEQDAVIIGTQDMLLSRALNRGYGMSRYGWPNHFGLLNNDCLWVFDEVQLMDVGVATSTQLEAFRRKLGTAGKAHSLWMSATLRQEWLNTVDFDLDWLGDPLELTAEDIEQAKDRYEASKHLVPETARMGDTEAVADAILKAHEPAARTLAVFNTVDRALAVYKEIKKRSEAHIVLIHSRFRPPDRETKIQELLASPPPDGTIAVTTQVVEAGVDVSAKALFTELAPWASLVQRFGRCNRRGEFNKEDQATVHWFDADNKSLEKLASPYSPADLTKAREHLKQLTDVGPASLAEVDAAMKLDAAHVIRRRDMIDLFDTTPDLAGNDIDVSRFIRSGEELDVQVFWRELPKGTKVPDPGQDHGKAARREELCRVPVYRFRDFVKKKQGSVWRWDGLTRKWSPSQQSEIYPGQTFLVRTDAGGYSADTGWDSGSKAPVAPVTIDITEDPAGYDHDEESARPGNWQTIAEHTDDVARELDIIMDALSLDGQTKKALREAVRWHDRGKAHPVFQNAIRIEIQHNGESVITRPDLFCERCDIAKAPNGFWQRYERKYFRHELASALAMLQVEIDDLAVYLVAAHHGKVRLSIRSLPGEQSPADPALLHARGVWDGDQLPEVDLGGAVRAPAVTLSLDCMQLGRSPEGRPSWVERMLKLREVLGPFRLSYLEALICAADRRASRESAQKDQETQEVIP